MTVQIEELLGKALGRFMQVVGDDNGGCIEEYLRVRVGIDVSVPL